MEFRGGIGRRGIPGLPEARDACAVWPFVAGIVVDCPGDGLAGVVPLIGRRTAPC